MEHSLHWERPVWSEYLPAEQSTQLVSSLSTGLYVLVGQLEQVVDVDEDMNEPGGQHPYRAVLAVAPEPRLVKAFLAASVKDSHAPPHNVRLNPLL